MILCGCLADNATAAWRAGRAGSYGEDPIAVNGSCNNGFHFREQSSIFARFRREFDSAIAGRRKLNAMQLHLLDLIGHLA